MIYMRGWSHGLHEWLVTQVWIYFLLALVLLPLLCMFLALLTFMIRSLVPALSAIVSNILSNTNTTSTFVLQKEETNSTQHNLPWEIVTQLLIAFQCYLRLVYKFCCLEQFNFSYSPMFSKRDLKWGGVRITTRLATALRLQWHQVSVNLPPAWKPTVKGEQSEQHYFC